MAPISDLLSSSMTYSEDEELFASWPGHFDPGLVDDGFEQFLEDVPSCTGSCPADFTRKAVASASFTGEPERARLQKGRSLSSDLGPVEPETKKLTAAERKLQSNRKAQKKFRQKQKVLHVLLSRLLCSASSCVQSTLCTKHLRRTLQDYTCCRSDHKTQK